MSKKIISLLTAVIIASSVLCSCGSDKESTETHDTTTTTIATTTEETSLRLPPKVTVSEFSLKKENTQSEATSTTKLKTTKKTETTTTKKPEEKPAEKPVPNIITRILKTTSPEGAGPAANLALDEHLLSNEDNKHDEMWFQDMDGDEVPDFIIGGSLTSLDYIQGAVRCYDIQLSSGNGGGIVILIPDHAHKQQYGHDAFMMQAYKDKNGTLMFTHTQFYAYTSGDPDMDMNYAGAFTIYEYSFAGGKGDSDKKQILYYTYDPRQGTSENAFSCTDGNGKRITASAAKQMFNSYYSSKTPLRANVKTINYQKYMREMTQEQRKQALMDSYYAFSYTKNKSIAPYGKEVFDKMPSAAAATTATTTTSKPQNSADNIYASYSAVLSSAKNRKSSAHAISYMVFDYDRDGKSELIIHYMTGARIGEAEIYEYNSNSGKSVLEAQGPCLALIGYSDKIGGLITTTVSNVPARPNSPSGASVVICKIVVAGKEISYDGVAQLDPDLDKELISEYTNSKKEFAGVDTNGCTADAVRANAAKNKAA